MFTSVFTSTATISSMGRQKDLERYYLDEARLASALFPAVEPVAHERPDFLFHGSSRTLGIEVTELCREDEREEGARLGYVAPKAKLLYTKMAPGRPIRVSPVLSPRVGDMKVEVLASGLARFVYDHRDRKGAYDWNDRGNELPEGFAYIGIFEPLPHEPDGKWHYFRAGRTTLATREQFEKRISEKNARVSDYRKSASEVWLLIVNDLFLGPGEVAVRADDITTWSFDSDFDRVLLFERQPGGAGKVIDIRRVASPIVPCPGTTRSLGRQC
jgi:hypothetical protein